MVGVDALVVGEFMSRTNKVCKALYKIQAFFKGVEFNNIIQQVAMAMGINTNL